MLKLAVRREKASDWLSGSSEPLKGEVYYSIFQLPVHVLSPPGVPRVLQARFCLPLALLCVPSSPAKTTKFKITVDTNQPPVHLDAIFPGKKQGVAPRVCVACFLVICQSATRGGLSRTVIGLLSVSSCCISLSLSHYLSLSLQSLWWNLKIRTGTVWLSSSCQEPKSPCWPPGPPVSHEH